jgi:DNA-directed RNA polymerase specialized sigma24 family protein
MIARNLCVDLGTQGWREHAVDGDGGGADPLAEAIADVAGADRIAMARESLGRLARAFRRLPAGQQLALELVRLEGFSMGAAAENLGVSVSSVKMSVFRGAAALRAALLDEEAPRRPSQDRVSLVEKEEPLGAA